MFLIDHDMLWMQRESWMAWHQREWATSSRWRVAAPPTRMLSKQSSLSGWTNSAMGDQSPRYSAPLLWHIDSLTSLGSRITGSRVACLYYIHNRSKSTQTNLICEIPVSLVACDSACLNLPLTSCPAGGTEQFDAEPSARMSKPVDSVFHWRFPRPHLRLSRDDKI